ncbi:MAG: hypothetical protein DRI69_05125 [Bacteroidetes bacterium]|nr:MAG: hypothetical protein DRI69_05125 [Bacteroidota bacterium]
MNYKTATISTFILFSLAFVIACGAQNDSLKTDEVLIENLLNDPLTKQIHDVQSMQKDLIMYNNLDMIALKDVIENTPNNDVCNITADISQIDRAAEYFDIMCDHISLIRQVREKYPQMKDLSPEILAQIFYPSEPVSNADVIRMIEFRDKID